MTLSWFGVDSTIAVLACMGELHLLVAVIMATSFTLGILGMLLASMSESASLCSLEVRL